MHTDHPGALAMPTVRALSPYVPGKPISELERELGIRGIVKLASNENPFGPSPRVIEAVRAEVAEVGLYPDGGGFELKRALAAHLGVSESQLTLGNGSNELLLFLAECFLSPAHSAIYSQYGFAIYPLVIQATGAQAIVTPAYPPGAVMPLGHDLGAMSAALRANTRLVIIANPNNPTGTWVEPAKLHAFIAAAPAETLIVLDEAYLEYGRRDACIDAISWAHEFPNLVLLRTFSKAYGLAGLRVGYAVSHPEVAEVLNRVRPAFNVSSLALTGARVALAEQAYMESCVSECVAERERLRAALLAMGLKVIPSAGNFLLVHFGPRAGQIYEQLLRAGFIVRPVGGYGLPEYLRITVGTREQHVTLLKSLGDCLRDRA
jgi:histidinol-phosphate aminotransferase